MSEPAHGQPWPFPTRCGPPVPENQRHAARVNIDHEMIERACRAHWPSWDRMYPPRAAAFRVKMQAALAAALYGEGLLP